MGLPQRLGAAVVLVAPGYQSCYRRRIEPQGRRRGHVVDGAFMPNTVIGPDSAARGDEAVEALPVAGRGLMV